MERYIAEDARITLHPDSGVRRGGYLGRQGTATDISPACLVSVFNLLTEVLNEFRSLGRGGSGRISCNFL